MCGIFGLINLSGNQEEALKLLTNHARRRGRDSSGLVAFHRNQYKAIRADYDVSRLRNGEADLLSESEIILGHSRLITDGFLDNQPVIREDIFVIHNGIITNCDPLWERHSSVQRELSIDSEVLNGIALDFLSRSDDLDELASYILENVEGAVSALIGVPRLGKLLLISNNGSMYVGNVQGGLAISSEAFPLIQLGAKDVTQVLAGSQILQIPKSENIEIKDYRLDRLNLVPAFSKNMGSANLLECTDVRVRRCSKCILPETMPFISFDEKGVCNYCRNYKLRNQPKPLADLEKLIAPYKNPTGIDCIVPFSGGRDSSFGLHLIVKELGLKAVAYTYDWGLVTDLGRRNISRVVSKLNVENIIVAADIEQKRKNVKKNIVAWLKRPTLGMISLFTAGDKHFFRYIEAIKKELGITLNIWSINPLEVTHFKAGFLGVAPDFQEDRVYMSNLSKQLEYQKLRLGEMLRNPGYFNASVFDTLQGEYYRSFHKKSDYYHLFDFYKWNEEEIDNVLRNEYDWELAVDTPTTWRIGDGTAAFYNYIYRTVAGFTEHDTFRSNQIREGDISRERALELVEQENQPRFENLKWYLDLLGLDFDHTIRTINKIPRLI